MRGVVTGVLFLVVSLSAEAFVSRSSLSPALIQQTQQQQRSITVIQTSNSNSNSKLFSSQWDEDDSSADKDTDDAAANGAVVKDGDQPVNTSPTWEAAGKAISDEDDKESMDEMGDDFDASPGYKASDIERYRDAIKKRADSLGIEKRSPEEIAEMEKRALASATAAREGSASGAGGNEKLSQMLDLSQISQDEPRGPDDNLPAMMYDPAKDMTDEEMIEADPTGQLPIQEQFMKVIKMAKFPEPSSVVLEVIILVVTIVVTATVISTWDNVMREGAFYFHMVPRPEETLAGMDDMVLPDTPAPLTGADMLRTLQEGLKTTRTAVQDGTLIDQLQQASGVTGDVPTDL